MTETNISSEESETVDKLRKIRDEQRKHPSDENDGFFVGTDGKTHPLKIKEKEKESK